MPVFAFELAYSLRQTIDIFEKSQRGSSLCVSTYLKWSSYGHSGDIQSSNTQEDQKIHTELEALCVQLIYILNTGKYKV